MKRKRIVKSVSAADTAISDPRFTIHSETVKQLPPTRGYAKKRFLNGGDGYRSPGAMDYQTRPYGPIPLLIRRVRGR